MRKILLLPLRNESTQERPSSVVALLVAIEEIKGEKENDDVVFKVISEKERDKMR